MHWREKQREIINKATNMVKVKSIIKKLELALESDNSHFILCGDDNKTALNRSDLQLILSLLNK